MECESKECQKLDDKLKRLVKPDTVFFGESLPVKFTENVEKDFKNCDLLIVMGTSLLVNPFAKLTCMVDEDCPRLLINRELVGDFEPYISESDENYRDVFIQGDCDDGCLKLAKKLGITKELINLQRKEHERLDNL